MKQDPQEVWRVAQTANSLKELFGHETRPSGGLGIQIQLNYSRSRTEHLYKLLPAKPTVFSRSSEHLPASCGCNKRVFGGANAARPHGCNHCHPQVQRTWANNAKAGKHGHARADCKHTCIHMVRHYNASSFRYVSLPHAINIILGGAARDLRHYPR